MTHDLVVVGSILASVHLFISCFRTFLSIAAWAETGLTGTAWGQKRSYQRTRPHSVTAKLSRTLFLKLSEVWRFTLSVQSKCRWTATVAIGPLNWILGGPIFHFQKLLSKRREFKHLKERYCGVAWKERLPKSQTRVLPWSKLVSKLVIWGG